MSTIINSDLSKKPHDLSELWQGEIKHEKIDRSYWNDFPNDVNIKCFHPLDKLRNALDENGLTKDEQDEAAAINECINNNSEPRNYILGDAPWDSDIVYRVQYSLELKYWIHGVHKDHYEALRRIYVIGEHRLLTIRKLSTPGNSYLKKKILDARKDSRRRSIGSFVKCIKGLVGCIVLMAVLTTPFIILDSCTSSNIQLMDCLRYDCVPMDPY